MNDDRSAHYLRFARALALVSIVGATGGCQQVRDRIGCEHCHCEWTPRTVRQPVSCELVGLPECCVPVEGPLPPPDLPA